MAVTDATPTTEQAATYDGKPVEIVDEESHRSEDMLKVRYTTGENKGATEWAFAEEVEQ